MNWLNNLPLEAKKVAELCSAPICIVNQGNTSLDGDNKDIKTINSAIWYPEEAICSCYRKVAVQNYLNLDNGTAPKWIKRQHSIKKHNVKKGIKQSDGYFTFEMLNANRIIKGNTKGINPHYDESIQLERFFKKTVVTPK